MSYLADIKAIKIFPRVNFDGSEDDFSQFRKDLNERVLSSTNPSASVLKRSRPIPLEAATHHYYIHLCAAKRQYFTERSEFVIARKLMETPIFDIERRDPEFLKKINWSRAYALSEAY